MENYTFKDGTIIPIPELTWISHENVDTTNAKMINIPKSKGSRNGEGIWVIGNDAFVKDYSENVTDTIHIVMLLNHSLYTSKHWGDFVPVKMLGAGRPVAIYEEVYG